MEEKGCNKNYQAGRTLSTKPRLVLEARERGNAGPPDRASASAEALFALLLDARRACKGPGWSPLYIRAQRRLLADPVDAPIIGTSSVDPSAIQKLACRICRHLQSQLHDAGSLRQGRIAARSMNFSELPRDA